MSYALPLIYIYVCTKFNFNPFCTFQDMAKTGIHYEKMVEGRQLCKYTVQDYGSCAMPFP